MALFSFTITAQKIKPYYGPFPFPAPNKNMQFYLQRTLDRNTVIYELNYDLDGELNKKKPIKIHWIDFEDGGKISPLTFTQNKFAYGIESELTDASKRSFELMLVSYPKIKLVLKRDEKNNNYRTHVMIKGKEATLRKIFVKITGGTFFNPHVAHIELEGNDLKTGADVHEKIIP